MKLTILGSGTTVPSKERSAPAYLLEVAGKLILLDSGEGTKRRIAEAGKNYLNIDYIFYTHTHVDHVGELPAIFWGFGYDAHPRIKKLIILGPKGFKKFYKKMLAAFWPQFEEKDRFPITITELKNKKIEIDGILVKTKVLDEQKSTLIKNSIGYRIEYNGKSLVYTGDVGYNENVIKLAKKADLLLIESAVPVETEGHLTPSQAGELAGKARVNKLILTHFYPAVERIDILAEAKKNFKGEITLAKDLMEIEI